ncbi:DUF6036 family nucleotidyltransferase [Candidatus Poriferisocius sp.]|uniref:DUF6036 family nucleotidyltransferase n=1 Tax=Candidatus Poriferisocius sp. TaxID=3101276 RepID=UPI003B02A0D2
MSTSDEFLPHDVLTGDRLRQLFDELDAELDAKGPRVEVVICGGAALAMGWDDRATHDVDALDEFPARLSIAIATVAARNGLRPDWLNHSASLFRPQGLQTEPVYEGDRLSVAAATRKYLLAMKAYAARPGDIADIEMLMNEQNVDSTELLPLVLDVYGPERAHAREDAIVLVAEAIRQRQYSTTHRQGPQPGIDLGL